MYKFLLFPNFVNLIISALFINLFTLFLLTETTEYWFIFFFLMFFFILLFFLLHKHLVDLYFLEKIVSFEKQCSFLSRKHFYFDLLHIYLDSVSREKKLLNIYNESRTVFELKKFLLIKKDIFKKVKKEERLQSKIRKIVKVLKQEFILQEQGLKYNKKAIHKSLKEINKLKQNV
jgi:hypothetical protein